ncbi:DNA topoisomerase VI subunit B [Candidatus Bathyarchaeota archaeon]|nr:MAG: DNA topoisomerase VI subunit B [Candidatus Bathyarchaeota archaeon]
MSQIFEHISPADFFYRNRDIAGFSNPSRAIYSAIRELVENSLDAAESIGVPPDIFIRLTRIKESGRGVSVYELRVQDNGTGVPSQHIPSAFGQVLFGSKYRLKQSRGTFGLGGTMAILYGQITTHHPAHVISSTGDSRIYEYRLSIDIRRNRPIILQRKSLNNDRKWRGTIVEFRLEGDYFRAMPKVLEYLKQTAVVNPYANITFIDPRGRLYMFTRATTSMPPPPKETKPHPYGVDVEMMQRLIQSTDARDMLTFMVETFHRVGKSIAKNFLKFAGISPKRDPKKLRPDEVVHLVQKMKIFDEFLPPDASCLSPLGEELLKAGIIKEYQPEFIAAIQRKPSTYSGHPFIVEAAIAYGGNIPKKGDIVLFRFANRIPLLYDESSDVSWKIIKSINWRRYKATPDMPIAIAVHVCSTKIPYKTVGKEFIADRPEVSREILFAIRYVARKLQKFLTRVEYKQKELRRLNIFARYLPKIARFSTDLAEKKRAPNVDKLIRSVKRIEED